MGRLANKLAHLRRKVRVGRDEVLGDRISAAEVVKGLTRRREENEESLFTLHGKQISGKLDLRHQAVKVAVDIQNCDFLGEVDLRYCEFAQVVNLSDCTFHQDFNSGGHHAANTVYSKDLICNKAIFKGTVGFYGSHVGGSAHFWKAEFQNTEIAADFSQSRFGRTLECEETVFRGLANFNGLKCGDTGVFYKARFESKRGADFGYASFGGNLECDLTTYMGPTSFNGVTVNGHAFFEKAKFESEQEATFSGAVIDRDLQCHQITFKGRANFNALQCGGAGLFQGAKFKGAHGINFDHACFGLVFDCGSCEDQKTIVEGPANFRYLKCSLFHAVGTIFRGATSFNTLECAGTGFFDHAEFQGEGGVDFGHATFEVNLVCKNVKFQGQADLDSLKCGSSGFFHDCVFEKKTDFNHAAFGKNLGCDNATFKAPASFRSLKCGDSGLFRNASFIDEANFGFATFGGDLECKGARTIFGGAANFNRVRCDGSGRFEEARFLSADKKTDFILASFGINLSLRAAYFAGSVDLTMTHVGQKLVLTAARFERLIALSDATVGQVEVKGSALPFAKGNLIMRGCNFAKFDGDEAIIEQFVKAQDPNEFSRDPYVQLERFYESVGKDVQARDTHYRGRLALRKNATRRGNHSTKWSQWRKVNDWLLKVLTGYGVYTYRIVLAILLFIALGTGVFSADEVLPVDQALVVTPSEVSVASGDRKPLPEPNALDGFFYSVDRAVPINMGVENELEPRPWWSEAYSLAHAIFGWLLIALFLASWTGLVRRSSR